MSGANSVIFSSLNIFKCQRESFQKINLIIFLLSTSCTLALTLALDSPEIQQRPRIQVEGLNKSASADTNNTQWHTVTVNDNDNANSGRASIKAHTLSRIRVICVAPYVMRWRVSKNLIDMIRKSEAERRPLLLSNGNGENFEHELRMEMTVDEGLTTYVQCQSVTNSSVYQRIQTFSPAAYAERTQVINYKGEPDGQFLIPCPARFPELDEETQPALIQIFREGSLMDHRENVTDAVYDRRHGFYIPASHAVDEVLEGTFQCQFCPFCHEDHEKDGTSTRPTNTATFIFNSDESDNVERRSQWPESHNESLPLGQVTGGVGPVLEEGGRLRLTLEALPGGDHEVKCENLDKTITRQLLINLPCSSPFECQLVQPCFKHSCALNWRSSLKSEPCADSAPCLTLRVRSSSSSGTILCTSGDKTVQHNYFTGIDGQKYLLNEAVPNSALIRMTLNHVNDSLESDTSYLFHCEASSFLYTPQLQFLALYNNTDKMRPLTPGSFREETTPMTAATTTDLGQRSGQTTTISRGIWLQPTTDMIGVVCQAPWFNSSSDWLQTRQTFTVHGVPSAGTISTCFASSLTWLFFPVVITTLGSLC